MRFSIGSYLYLSELGHWRVIPILDLGRVIDHNKDRVKVNKRDWLRNFEQLWTYQSRNKFSYCLPPKPTVTRTRPVCNDYQRNKRACSQTRVHLKILDRSDLVVLLTRPFTNAQSSSS